MQITPLRNDVCNYLTTRVWHLACCAAFLGCISLFFENDCDANVWNFLNENKEGLGWDGWFTAALIIVTFIALIREIRPPDIIMFVGASTLTITGIISPTQFLMGFSNEIIMTIAMLCIIVRALEINGVLEILARRVLSQSENYMVRMSSLVFPVGVASAFMNNTPIVLLMTPIVRRWALDARMSPSKFLIPLSYATILGGVCTIIGTSTNVIVAGLLQKNPRVPNLSFFELSYIGIPLFIIGGLFLIFFSRKLLPDRIDAATAVSEEVGSFTAEFNVEEESPLHMQRVKDLAKYFRSEVLIEVERNDILIDSPGPDFSIMKGDRLVFAGDVNQIAELHTIPGLKSVADPHFKIDVGSSHLAEVVIPTTSLLIGKTLKLANFRTIYGASVFAIYRQGRRVPGSVGNIALEGGDMLMLLSGEPWSDTRMHEKDFLHIRPAQKLQIFHPWRAGVVLSILAGMILMAIVNIPIMIASLIAAFCMIITGNISLKEAQGSIAWSLLLLIASSFALASAMETTGVAHAIASKLLSVLGNNPYMLVGGVLLLCVVGTEFLSNNAAALIFFPIAVQIAKLGGYTSPDSIKTIGVTIAIGCSCAFALPTGYQTNMIVYGPGGYRFTDFARIGVLLNILVFIVGTLLIPTIWPLKD